MLLKYAGLIAGLMVTTSAFAQSANADILTAQGKTIGTAQIQASVDGVRITIQVSQLPGGTHGIHTLRGRAADG